MKITRYICDACKAEIVEKYTIAIPPLSLPETSLDYENIVECYGNRFIFKDLCPKCYNKVLNVINQNDMSAQLRGW